MPGDLNLKKSWNPALVKTQAKIWQQEQKTLEEFNKIKQREEELKKEKELNDLIALKYKFNDNMNKQDKLKVNKLNWMYDVPAQKEKPEVKVDKVDKVAKPLDDPMKKFMDLDPMKSMRKDRVHKGSHRSHRSSDHRGSHKSDSHKSDSHKSDSHRSHSSHSSHSSHRSHSHRSHSHKSHRDEEREKDKSSSKPLQY